MSYCLMIFGNGLIIIYRWHRIIITKFIANFYFEKMSKGKQLTMDLVFTKTKSDSLHNIKNLNLWGNDLQDLSLIEKMPNLSVVSLSVNRISSLKDFAKCPNLQQLYLRKNNITDISQILHLTKLPNLKVLWLHDNPCAQIENYREIVIKHLPTLMKLDNSPVSNEEKINALKLNIKLGNQQIQLVKVDDKEKHNNSIYEEEESKLAENKWMKNKMSQPYEEKALIMGKKSERVQKPPSRVIDRQQERYEQEERYSNKVSTNTPQQKSIHQNPQSSSSKKQVTPTINRQIERNQNIVMAVLSLLQELDPSSLQIVRRQTQKLLEN